MVNLFKTKFVEKNKNIIFALIICFVITVLAVSGLYVCPYRFVLGIPCPCCGMTRALKAVISGNISKSFEYHPMWPIAVVGVVIHVLCEFKIIIISKKWSYIGLYFIAISLIVCYIFRMFW